MSGYLLGELHKLFQIYQSMELNEAYWSTRYEQGQTGWDIGYVSTPIKEYIDQLDNKDVSILIPGAGNAYEAEYLWKKGFRNVTVVDLSQEPLSNLKKRIPDFEDKKLVKGDFFDLKETYDLVIEQTFFCALVPSMRNAYVTKMHQIIKPTGKLVGLLFNIPLYQDHPPFGGHRTDYEPLFSDLFQIEVMDTAYNSITPRAGNELFIKLSPKR